MIQTKSLKCRLLYFRVQVKYIGWFSVIVVKPRQMHINSHTHPEGFERLCRSVNG